MPETHESGRRPRRKAGAKPGGGKFNFPGEAPPALRPRPFRGGNAEPQPGVEARIGFVGIDDIGCRSRGLFSNTPLLVQPCNQFLGTGIYQLFAAGDLITRWCMQRTNHVIHVESDTRKTCGEGVDMFIEDFEDRVSGLVLATLGTINEAFMRNICEMRSKHYG